MTPALAALAQTIAVIAAAIAAAGAVLLVRGMVEAIAPRPIPFHRDRDFKR